MSNAPRLGKRQLEVLCRMAGNAGGTVPMTHRWQADVRVAATLEKHGLVRNDPWRSNGEPDWKITDDGRIAAERSRAGKPELCFRCDKLPAAYVSFSGAQSGSDIGYPSAHLLCQVCFDHDRETYPDIRPSRTYRLAPLEAA